MERYIFRRGNGSRYRDGQPVIKLTPEAYNALVEIYNESQLSMKQIASLIIMQSLDRIVYDKEGETS